MSFAMSIRGPEVVVTVLIIGSSLSILTGTLQEGSTRSHAVILV